jgi:bifunctional DNase/RNase
MLHKVSIAGLTMDPSSNTPIIILKSDENEQTVPIWIGLLEATAIVSALQKVKFERPMTHDLLKNFIDEMKVQVTRVEVCDLHENTFYARIYCTHDQKEFDVDARPSDAIAVAIRADAPIFMDEKVIEKSSVPTDGNVEVMDTSEEGQKWAEYLQKLSPDEFGK